MLGGVEERDKKQNKSKKTKSKGHFLNDRRVQMKLRISCRSRKGRSSRWCHITGSPWIEGWMGLQMKISRRFEMQRSRMDIPDLCSTEAAEGRTWWPEDATVLAGPLYPLANEILAVTGVVRQTLEL